MKHGFIKAAAISPRIAVADCDFNASAIIGAAHRAADASASLLVLPELCVTGATAGDLFLQSALLASAESALMKIARETADLDLLITVGLPLCDGPAVYNAAAILHRGRILGAVPKAALSDHGEWAESRIFTPGTKAADSIRIGGEAIPFGCDLVFTCDACPDFSLAAAPGSDLFRPASAMRLAASGATVIAVPAASPTVIGRDEACGELLRAQSRMLVSACLYAGAGAGESTTDAVYGGSLAAVEYGRELTASAPFASDEPMIVTEMDTGRLMHERRRLGMVPDTMSVRRIGVPLEMREVSFTREISRTPFLPSDQNALAKRCEEILAIQSHALAKRLTHARAKTAVIGISGGLDSCLALLVSVRAMDLLNRPRTDILAVTMPCFGTTKRTRSNAEILCERLGVRFKCVDIMAAVNQHFADIGHDPENRNVVYENVQARERTQVIMDIANEENGLVIGTGDLSELALGWATYNGDHMSMYGVNGSVPKTLVKYIVRHFAMTAGDPELGAVLLDIFNTPVSPELLPADEKGEIAQKTEDLVGPYELHDFFLYHFVRWGTPPRKLERLARAAFAGVYDDAVIHKWLTTFIRRFFIQQFKRSCLPDGPKVGSISLSPRSDWHMPSDAVFNGWLETL